MTFDVPGYRIQRLACLLSLAMPLLVLPGALAGSTLPGTLTGIATDPSTVDLELSPVADGFDEPVRVTYAGDGTERLFVVEKRGVIWIVDDGEKLERPFLDISERVLDVGFEQGLYSIAFHPEFETNGYFFVVYTSEPEGNNVLARFELSALDPNRADPDSERRLFDIEDPQEYHNGGDIAFSPIDGYLYYATGDGGLLTNMPQDPGSLFGKMLRIDVDDGDPYAIPDDNPFIEDPAFHPEIWALGLRNPWRFSFDRETGDLFIGDVGGVRWEELDYQPATSPGGENYGWPVVEGFHCQPPEAACDPAGFTPPIIEYPSFDPVGEIDDCAITAGTTYRGSRTPALNGAFFFADWCSGRIFMAYRAPDDGWQHREIADTGLQITSIAADEQGELLLTDMAGGVLYRMILSAPNPAPRLDSISPPGLIAGAKGAVLELRGGGFVSTSAVSVNGVEVESEFISSSLLLVELPRSLGVRPGVLTIVVRSPEPGGGESEALELQVLDGESAGSAFERIWARTDAPVRDGAVVRSWIWGPEPLTGLMIEPYAEAPDGVRIVGYYDKSRMEITNPEGDSGSPWYVTNGLLVTELITGRVQTGDGSFEDRLPAEINVAGDLNDPSAPTYASFTGLLDAPALSTGTTIVQHVDRDGDVATDPELSDLGVTAAYVDEATGHAIASPFWEFMNSTELIWENGNYTTDKLFANPFFATGRPITEAYWASVKVANSYTDVLVQCFERRCLTYTPNNSPGWRVEAGNAGQHYYQWRYDDSAVAPESR